MSSSKPKPSNLKHYYMVAAQILFYPNDYPDQLGTVTNNALLALEDKNVCVRDIAKAQQLAQLQFYKHIPDNNVTVVNVVLLSLSYLGHMTEEYLQATPPGTQMVKRDPLLQALDA